MEKHHNCFRVLDKLTLLCVGAPTAEMLGHLITWVSLLTLVSSQCFVQEVSNTRENGMTQKEIEINFGEEVQGF